MKRITLHRPAVDNSGGYVDAGGELLVGDAAEPNTITATRARELVDVDGAIDPDASPVDQPTVEG